MRPLAGIFLALALLASVVAADQKGSTTEWNLHKENGYLPVIAIGMGGLAVILFTVSIITTTGKSQGRRVALFAALAAMWVMGGYASQFIKMFPYERDITNAGPAPYATETIYPTYWWFKVPAEALITVAVCSYLLTGQRNSMWTGAMALFAASSYVLVLYASWGNWRWFAAIFSGVWSIAAAVFAAGQTKRLEPLAIVMGLLYAVFPFIYQLVVMFGPYWFWTNEMTLWNQTLAHMILDMAKFSVLPLIMSYTAITKMAYAALVPGSRAAASNTYVQVDDATVISGNGKSGHPAFIAADVEMAAVNPHAHLVAASLERPYV